MKHRPQTHLLLHLIQGYHQLKNQPAAHFSGERAIQRARLSLEERKRVRELRHEIVEAQALVMQLKGSGLPKERLAAVQDRLERLQQELEKREKREK